MVCREFRDEDVRHIHGIGDKNVERQIAFILKEGVPATYTPRSKVLSMSVACGRHLSESFIIKSFHQLRYGINSNDIVTIGCDLQEVGQLVPTGYDKNGPFGEVQPRSCDSDYDAVFRGVMVGDSSMPFPWDSGLLYAGSSFGGAYDFVHINYPDLIDMGSWGGIVQRALLNLTRRGMLSIVSLDDDILKLKELEDALRSEGECRTFPTREFRYSLDDLHFDYGLLCAQRRE